MREYPLQYASTDKNKKSHYNRDFKILFMIDRPNLLLVIPRMAIENV